MLVFDATGITKPTVSYPTGVRPLAWLIAVVTIWAWLPVVLVFLILPTVFCCSHRNRCMWALEEWGSDHLPVVCSLAIEQGDAGNTKAEAGRHVNGI